MTLYTFRRLCNHHHYPFPEFFIISNRIPYPLNNNSLFSCSSEPKGASALPSLLWIQWDQVTTTDIVGKRVYTKLYSHGGGSSARNPSASVPASIPASASVPASAPGSVSTPGSALTSSFCFPLFLALGRALFIATQAKMAYHQQICKHVLTQYTK